MKRRTIDLSDDIYAAMEKLKKKSGMTHISIIRLALIDFFAKHGGKL